LRLILAITALLLLIVGNISAQEKSTVIITGHTNFTQQAKYEIEIVKPNYITEKKEYKDVHFYATIKKEVDYWVNQGYKLIETTSNSLGQVNERITFILIKEE